MEEMNPVTYWIGGIGLILFTLGACAIDSTGIYYAAAVVLMAVGGILFWIGAQRYENEKK